MSAKYFSDIWTALAPALGDHLWQSTLLVLVAGVLSLTLKKNRACARYWLWLAASLKFLLPLSLLASVGSQLAWLRKLPPKEAQLYYMMNAVSQPFTQPSLRVNSPPASQSLIHFLPVILAGMWLCGCVAVLAAWYARWRRVAVAIQKASPLREGREVEALRRMERRSGLGKQIEMRVSIASLEPGIFGIVGPVLLWPAGISEHLEDAHLEAIVAHEVWHVRRRDNLAAAIHMMVEAIFWFHPLVWWLGARLVEERERACDEEVLALGSERQIYAESILKTCQFCAGFSLACVSGVTGADLKKRIARIMTASASHKLNFGKKLLLSATASAAIVMPVLFGLLHAAPSRADVQVENFNGGTAVSQMSFSNPDKPNGIAVSVAKTDVRKTKKCTKSLKAAKAVASPKSTPMENFKTLNMKGNL